MHNLWREAIHEITSAGVSQYQIAKRIGVDQSTVSRMAEGTAPEPRYGVGVKLLQLRDSCKRPADLTQPGEVASPKTDPLTADPALNTELVRAEQAGLVKLPHPAPAWDGVERRVAQVPRRAVDRELLDIARAGQGA